MTYRVILGSKPKHSKNIGLASFLLAKEEVKNIMATFFRRPFRSLLSSYFSVLERFPRNVTPDIVFAGLDATMSRS